MTRSPWTLRAASGDLPAASLDSRRESIADTPRAWSLADLRAWSARESAAASRDDDAADAAARAIRRVVR